MRFIADQLRRWYPEEQGAVEEALATWPRGWDEIVRDCIARGWYLNRGVLDAAALTVVHSPWCRETIRKGSPGYAEDVVVIPHGIHPHRTTPSQRAAVRERFKLPAEALVFASFGFVHRDKMSPEALDAFAAVAREHPDALFVFAGEEIGGEVRAHAAALGLGERVRFLGRQPHEAFLALMPAADVGVTLRRPPTNGETSGALLHLLAAGVPTIVTDVDTFSDYPAAVVRKVRWESEGAGGLLRGMRELAADRAGREALGRAALAHVEAYHDWPRVARLHVDAIERCHERLARARRSPESNRQIPRPVPVR
jgi:glycosyltransferase involved in cell wall biosynthesis